MKLKKRGGVSIAFNWIFVLLIAGVLFFFFFNIINNQMEGSNLQTQVDVQTKLSQITYNAMQNPGMFYEIKTKAHHFDYGGCNEGIYMNDDRNRYVRLKTFFAPQRLESTQNIIYAWVLPWEMPYRVADFLFMTTPDVKYYFIDNTGWNYIEKITDDTGYELPEKINNKTITDLDQIELEDESAGRVRIVIFGSVSGSPSDVTIPPEYEGEVTAVIIEPENNNEGLDGIGALTFYELNEERSELEAKGLSSFIGKVSVFAAIFSETQKIYECGMNQALDQMETSFAVTDKRLQLLSEGDSGVSQYCKNEDLYRMQNSVLFEESTFSATIDKIYQNVYNENGYQSLRFKNKNLQRKSCPMIY